MHISAGTTIGSYRVTQPLGKGGMGEVWRARDTRLDRDVALKALPAEFAIQPDRLARFEREAKVLASLNHPHIAGIYGLEAVATRRTRTRHGGSAQRADNVPVPATTVNAVRNWIEELKARVPASTR